MNSKFNKKVPFIAIILLFLVFITVTIYKTDTQHYENTHYHFSYPTNGKYNYQYVTDTITIIKYRNHTIGSICVYPQSEYSNSVNSIITNIYGMHAYLKEVTYLNKSVPYLSYCILVGYEPSAATEIKAPITYPSEQHYLFIKDDGTIIDFGIQDSFVNSESICVIENFIVR